MPEQTAGTPAEVQDTPLRNPHESTCVHTKKIYDSCQSKDCLEDLRVYPTRSSQSVLDGALSIRPGSATLLHVHMDVQPVGLGRGNYTVDMRFYYRLTAEAAAGCARYAPVTGLAVFDKRCILFGCEGRSRRFTSDSPCQAPEAPLPTGDSSLPTAVCEAVDPLILSILVLVNLILVVVVELVGVLLVVLELQVKLLVVRVVEQWLVPLLVVVQLELFQ